MKNLFKVGDIVTIRSDLNISKRYYNIINDEWNNVTSGMMKLVGKKVTITDIRYDYQYICDKMGVGFTEEMFEETFLDDSFSPYIERKTKDGRCRN